MRQPPDVGHPQHPGHPLHPARQQDPAPATADDFYRRAGRFASGAIQDAAWLMELDAVTAWLDGLRLGPVVVELGAGTGWWSTLLAAGGELWAYDPSDAALDELRRRLVAHGLRAHLHKRDLDAPAERTVDAVFTAFALGGAQDDTSLARRLDAIAGWLRPGGSFAFVEVAGDAAGAVVGPVVEGPTGPLRRFGEADLRDLLDRHGLRLASVAPGGRALIAGVAEAVGGTGGDPARDAPVAHAHASVPAAGR